MVEIAAKKTDKDRLDELIDWYEQHKPEAGQRIKVRFQERQLRTFANQNKDGTWSYRDRVLEQIAS